MKLSIEVGHPAHVHYWHPVRQALLSRGHDVVVFARGKETTFALLRRLEIPFIPTGRNYPTLVGKGVGMLHNSYRVLLEAARNQVNLMLSGGMPYSAQASAVLGIPHLAIIDTEHAKITLAATLPFTDVVCTPACFKGSLGRTKHVRFQGYVESMYLRPEYFQPRKDLLEHLGLKAGDPVSVVRFSSWDASHDLHAPPTGLETTEGKERLVRELSEFGPVFLSSEVPLPPSLTPYANPAPLEDAHSLLAYASLYCGEGAKMAAEAGILGTPWIYISPVGRSYLDEQETRYGLGRTVSRLAPAIDQARDWLEGGGAKPAWAEKRLRLLSSTVDVTQVVVHEIENLMGARYRSQRGG